MSIHQINPEHRQIHLLQWQIHLSQAIKDIDHDDLAHDLSYLLEEPIRGKGYSLDYFLDKSDRNSDLRGTPLKIAIDCKCVKCLEQLLGAGASAGYCGKEYEETPLMHTVRQYACVRSGPQPQIEPSKIVKILLEHGADVNASAKPPYRYDACLNPHLPPLPNQGPSFTALQLACHHRFPGTVQVMLDHGAQLLPKEEIYSQVFFSKWHNEHLLRVFLEHFDKFNLEIPLDKIWKWNVMYNNNGFGTYIKPSNYTNLQIVLSCGYIPDKNSKWVRCCFVQAVEKNDVESNKLACMMLDLEPMMLQACRDLLIKTPHNKRLRKADYLTRNRKRLAPRFQELLANPSSLEQLCKGAVISAIGHRFLKKVTQLKEELPSPVIDLLATVKEKWNNAV